ncbi:MAG TPA: hypothetical protein V6D11_24995 [Waterburya sp.]|jgi:hypothetical protein
MLDIPPELSDAEDLTPPQQGFPTRAGGSEILTPLSALRAATPPQNASRTLTQERGWGRAQPRSEQYMTQLFRRLQPTQKFRITISAIAQLLKIPKHLIVRVES